MQTTHPDIILTDPSQCNNVLMMATTNARKAKLVADFKQIVLELSIYNKNLNIVTIVCVLL